MKLEEMLGDNFLLYTFTFPIFKKEKKTMEKNSINRLAIQFHWRPPITTEKQHSPN